LKTKQIPEYIFQDHNHAKTDRDRHDIEACYQCGRTFLRDSGYSHTGVDGDKEFTVWCCSDNCLQAFHDRELSYKAQKTIEARQSPGAEWEKLPWSERREYWESWKAVELDSNPYQSIIDATDRAEAKEPIDNACHWCGYSMDDEPLADGKFCRPRCKEWYLATQKTTRKQDMPKPKPSTKPNAKPMNLMKRVSNARRKELVA
jgi:hypothetical protein